MFGNADFFWRPYIVFQCTVISLSVSACSVAAPEGCEVISDNTIHKRAANQVAEFLALERDNIGFTTNQVISIEDKEQKFFKCENEIRVFLKGMPVPKDTLSVSGNMAFSLNEESYDVEEMLIDANPLPIGHRKTPFWIW